MPNKITVRVDGLTCTLLLNEFLVFSFQIKEIRMLFDEERETKKRTTFYLNDKIK